MSEDYWYNVTRKGVYNPLGFFKGPGVETSAMAKMRHGKEAITEFSEELQSLKENNPVGFGLFITSIRNIKSNVLLSAGISSVMTNLTSAMTAGLSRAKEQISFMIGAMASTNPAIQSFRNFIVDLTVEIEKITQENWMGSTAGALLGAALSTYMGAGPQLGMMFGGVAGGWVENYYDDLLSNDPQAFAFNTDPLTRSVGPGLKIFWTWIKIFQVLSTTPVPWGHRNHDRDNPTAPVGTIITPTGAITQSTTPMTSAEVDLERRYPKMRGYR